MKIEITNPVIDGIMARRSTRNYKSEQITDAERDTIITAALNAPSARNAQPWYAAVVQDPAVIKELNDAFLEVAMGIPELAERYSGLGASVFHNAPTVVLVARDAENEYAMFDSGTLSENLCLAAESLGIGTCIIGFARMIFGGPKAAEIEKKLGFPEGYKFAISIAVGYKNEMSDPKPREEKVRII